MSELERVVVAMRRVVERLQGENSSLKKALAAAKSRKNGQTDKKVLEEENSRLKVTGGMEGQGEKEREGREERERERGGAGGYKGNKQ